MPLFRIRKDMPISLLYARLKTKGSPMMGMSLPMCLIFSPEGGAEVETEPTHTQVETFRFSKSGRSVRRI